ncbi:hypothetical protein D043_2538A, partial [Vibrio parahaemolyticus EKP-021]
MRDCLCWRYAVEIGNVSVTEWTA